MSKYHKDVSHIKTLDPYRLQELYQMHPCAEHVVKKLLVAGERSGGKSLDTDIADCIWTLQRWQEMRAEDASRVDATSNDSSQVEYVSAAKIGDGKLSRYRWSEKPERFKWAATDRNGHVYLYELEPHIVDDKSIGWTGAGIMGVPLVGMCKDWRESLEARP